MLTIIYYACNIFIYYYYISYYISYYLYVCNNFTIYHVIVSLPLCYKQYDWKVYKKMLI